ncbi:MAG: peroxiredoxin [Bacteroidetes bacterium]|jgi:peroxiredoxin Q/BCP|nr:peroxiredoxin [Bacteroidota bacterium]MDF1868278.1 peroxiredoxin [Saprospiraceae bacterium]
MQNQKIAVGDAIPKFELQNQNDETVAIESFFGKPFVLYFYPKDDTPGCTMEACTFRDQYEDFREVGAEVIGVSADSPDSHKNFAKKHNLPFVLLSDHKNEVRKMFGVPSSMFGLLPGRVTYIIDEKGTVSHVFDSQMQAKKHVKEAIEHLKN